jgi:hypothetical protein
MTGCPCHEAAVFGHVQRDCPRTMVPAGQRRSEEHISVHRPVRFELAEMPATVEQLAGQMADRRRRVLARLFTP